MQGDRAFRTHAIILKRRDFNEADRLLTILTATHGKLDVIAKGARKPTSAKTGHVELFTRVDMLIHRGRDFGILVQAEVVMPYLGLREDLGRSAYASYAAELVDRFFNEGDLDLSRVFRLFDETLNRLCTDDDPRLVIRYFEIHLLDLAGYRPDLQECASGHEPILPQDQYFSFTEGGAVCPNHAVKSPYLVPLPLITLKMFRHMQRNPYAKIKSLKLTDSLYEDSERVLVGYITNLLERRLESIDFIRLLRR